MKLSVQGTALQATRRYDPGDLEQVAVQLTGLDTLVGVGSLPVPDRTNVDEWYSGRRVVIIDGPADELRLEGYITSQTRDRPAGEVLGREAGLQVGDANELLHHRRANKYKRPAETDVARVLAFAADMYADLALDTSWVLDEFTVDLPEKTYDGDDFVSDLAAELAEWAGKTLFLHMAWDGTTRTPHLHYHRLNDRGHAVSFSLTDDVTAVNHTTVLGYRAETVHRDGDGFDLFNDVLARDPGGDTVTVTDGTSQGQHDADGVLHQTLYDTDAADLTELTALANNLLLARKGERYSYQATTEPMAAAKAAELSGGALIEVTSIVWAITNVTMRIANVTLRPKLKADGTFLWTADLELDRPIRRAKPPIGKPGPKACDTTVGVEVTAGYLEQQRWNYAPGFKISGTSDVVVTKTGGGISHGGGTHLAADVGFWFTPTLNVGFYCCEPCCQHDPVEMHYVMEFDTSGFAAGDCTTGGRLHYRVAEEDCACGPYELVSGAKVMRDDGNKLSVFRAGKPIGAIDLSQPSGDDTEFTMDIPKEAIKFGGMTRLAVRPRWKGYPGGTFCQATRSCDGHTSTSVCGNEYQVVDGPDNSMHRAKFGDLVFSPRLELLGLLAAGCKTSWTDATCATHADWATVPANNCDDLCCARFWKVCGHYRPGTLEVSIGGRVLKRGKWDGTNVVGGDFAETKTRKVFVLRSPGCETPKTRYTTA